ncbi:glycosyltransferase family 2 protein [Geodermatophilus obscurus]|uniref:Glycosyl transferase family 2 n=1 Tax=Geodermatophilus obscurus (strain ATCC 25078 / DSM 43160 / JCM 3152 / CCUG 61914 / KCC A-0152 / KCTC 9177 / NBRC 13315 / NRRL B-3577 / G-20) TaxID=526225 RepID=D2S555_GEOOG|nr:glycosyl transferase family 2 [Geodermatophilus obscurus DSM 43160]
MHVEPSQSTGTPDVELVVVAYRSRAQVTEMLAGLPADIPLAVVDNFNDGDGLAQVVLDRPNGRYMKGGGIGYSRAANLAARSSQAEFLVFLNPDTRPDIEAITTLVEDVATDPLCSASAGVVVDSHGRPEWAVGGWEPTLPRAVVHAFGAHRAFPRLGIYCHPEIGQPLNVDWVSGSVMAVRRQTFLGLDCFDEDFYVYNDDVAFGRQSRAHGLYQRLRTDVAIPSAGGSGAPSLEMGRLHGSSMSRYLHKYHHPVAATTIIMSLGLGYIGRALGRLLLGHINRAREDWAHALGLFTARATVAGRLVADGRRGRPVP